MRPSPNTCERRATPWPSAFSGKAGRPDGAPRIRPLITSAGGEARPACSVSLTFRRRSGPGTLVAMPAATTPGCTRLGQPQSENTRPRLDRCSAHRVRPQRPHRPRSRPVFGPPLRQLASDPFHPVEGGSANDYDYCSGDPVNCYDLSGLYSYTYSYDLGKGGSAEAVMSAIKADPSRFFPFDIAGSGGEDSLQKGSVYDLTGAFLPGKVDTVRVTDMTPTSFTFSTFPGHSEGFPATITFRTRVDSRGHVIFSASARGPSGRFGFALNPYRHFVAKHLWSNFAYNIRRYLNAPIA